jgi:drug/metabolite transporter (DMT)-like permease
MNIFTGGVIQSIAAFAAVLINAIIFESMSVMWTGQFFFALTWMTVVVSIGAVSLLYILIRQGEVSQVASIFYLVPVSTVVLSFLIYHQTIDYYGLLGMIITAMGIVLVNKNYQAKTIAVPKLSTID